MRNTFVYWMFDLDGECLYVGLTKYPRQRWVQHQRKPWFGSVASKRMAGPFLPATARQLERQQQDELQPRHDRIQTRLRTRARILPGATTRWAGHDLPVAIPAISERVA